MKTLLGVVLVIGLGLGLGLQGAHADPVADFYKGKQIKIIVGAAVGGGYDLYARALARRMGHYIPGNPTLIVQNQPGAGGVTLTNQLYQQGPKDGTAMGAPLSGIPTAPMLQAGANYDPTKLNWLGSISTEAYVAYAWHTAPVSRIQEVAHTELLVGGTTLGSSTVDYPVFMNEMLGYKFKVVRGYVGPPEINIAIERGEVQGNGSVGWSLTKSLKPDWLKEKKINVILQFGLRKHPELPEVPLVMDLAQNDQQRQAMKLMFARSEYGRPFFIPQDVPAERVAALRQAFDQTMKDPEFLAEAARLQLEVDPMSGVEMQKLVTELANTSPDVVGRVRAILTGTASR
jgi:tripartite-type tricarboxylate transporter receptor subunit TctC